MSLSPKISIITPVWNGLPYIRECVESVLKQDFQNWEMLIGDNASTDGTLDYLDTLSDPRIRVFKHAENLRIYGNLNILFKHVRSPVVQMLCADDYFIEGGLRRAIAEWKRLGDDIGLIRFNWGESTVNTFCHSNIPEIVPAHLSDFYYFLFGNLPGNLSNVSVRTGAVFEAGGFREHLPYTGDFEMWSRMARKKAQVMSVTRVSFVRRHPGVASNYLNRKGELVGQTYEVIETIFKNLKSSFSTWMLRFHAAVNFDAPHRYQGVAMILRGRSGGYLREVTRHTAAHTCLPPQIFCWLLCLLTLGGRIGRNLPARLLLRQMAAQAGNP